MLLEKTSDITPPTMLKNKLYRQAEATIPTDWGEFRMIAYSESKENWMPHLALVHKEYQQGQTTTLRLHSECITGDLFSSKRCDCGEQLDFAMKKIAQEKGILLYLRQEGRGIGIINKLKAYQLQDKGLNTVDANVHLGLKVDARQYDIAMAMLADLGVKGVHLLTNNPEKINAFDQATIKVISRLPIVIEPHEGNESYLKTKKEQMGHLF